MAKRDPDEQNLVGRLAQRVAAEDQQPLPWFLDVSLRALSRLYRGLYVLDRLPYQAGWRQPERLPVPVISLGNLAAGGTGKTPAAIWLVNFLRSQGKRPVLVSHGYGAPGRAPAVVSVGQSGAWPDAGGDEARLAAVSCPGVPVVSGRDRIAAARLALCEFTPDMLVFDDAFQYWALGRDLDLVLLDSRLPLGNGFLLPRGWLREPPSMLARAGALILVGPRHPPDRRLPSLPIFQAELAPVSLTGFMPWRGGERHPIENPPARAAAFCGLAHPERFLATLAGLGCTIERHLDLPDHRAPAADSFRAWLASGSSPVITTEKDAVKLTPELFSLVEASGRELLVLGVSFAARDVLLGQLILDRLDRLSGTIGR